MHTGLLLPHFGQHADPTKIVDGSRLAERLGFDSVWVRDHLLFEPHGEFENPDTTFYEALTTLTAIGASTERLVLGTGALIPFRHPLVLAQAVATMVKFFGPRLILGMGSGNFDHEFEAVGFGGVPRPDLVIDNFKILRQMWSEEGVSWDKDPFAFKDASQDPRPGADAVPLWYCGTTPKSARLAAEFGDGFLPGRIGIATLRKRVALLREQAELHQRPMSTVGVIPTTSVARTREEALARVNVPGLLTWANNAPFWVKPESGTFETVDDLAGVLLYGTPDDILEQIAELKATGLDHLAFDFRLSFPEWEDQMQLLGEEVLPHIEAL
ncbi:MAG TPA: LLM class flavin-dependent oxidoreductase [Marmoricola sp.]|jgi:alkanesulfonate monooxygenase SsuD/methylene tetrahydromethanopterin reductase-like flavin-dependent oxidoreductase (luciferase family)|nr:LLM class flavin-dependent oxidoreductase [Marmoricola sp.]